MSRVSDLVLHAVALLTPLGLGACGAAEPLRLPIALGQDLFVEVPADNPLTRERVELGRRLFFDSSLSADGKISCSSCHRPDRVFADTAALSRGAFGREGRRNAPSLLNVAYRRTLFWDGREERLEEQVLLPIESAMEMDRDLDDLVDALKADRDYRRGFRVAFREEPSVEGVGRALASFLRTLRAPEAPADRFRYGERDALSPEAQRGFQLFVGRARCSSCHLGPNFTDHEFHNTGIAARSGDGGRYAVTGDSAAAGAIRTPMLRNVARTAPYMHDGSLGTLEEVIDFYDAGGISNPNLDPLIRPLGLSEEERLALVAFLEALTSEW